MVVQCIVQDSESYYVVVVGVDFLDKVFDEEVVVGMCLGVEQGGDNKDCCIYNSDRFMF